MDLEYLSNLLDILGKGLIVTGEIFLLTILFAIPLGIIISLLSLSRSKLISRLIKLYILIMRGTPLILQIICIYFAPYYIFNFSYDRFVAVIIAFSLNYAAYFGEIFRGGIQSIPEGQYYAAYTLGFTKIQSFFKIVLPQVIKKVLPAMSNEIITLVRDTSLAQVIGVTELFSLAQKQSSYKFSIIPLIVAGGIYLLITVLLTTIFHYTEKKLDYYK